MAATYAFRFILRQTEFEGGFAQVVFGGPDTVYLDECKTMSYAEAKKHLDELSAKEPRSHTASLMMRYAHDRVPPGFRKDPNFTHVNREVVPFV
ncbi:hypothetical protein D9M70_325060 [compost metagenome]